MEEKLLKLAVIGLGNCGCMMTNDACKELGIDGIAINASKRDLMLVDCPAVTKFTVGDGNGTGKDRDNAKRFFLTDSGFVMDTKFNSVIESNDVIFIATSTGGGFGSGSSVELVELLTDMYPNKVVIVVGVLPFNDEMLESFEGTKSWLAELNNLNTTYIIYDNNNYVGKMSPNGKMTPNQAAQRVNMEFINDLKVLQGDFISMTRTGGIDERDLLTVLSVPKRLVIGSMTDVEVSDIIDGSLIKTIKQHIDTNSAHAELVSDKAIVASATMYALGSEFDEFKLGIKADMKDTFGVHIKDPSNYSDVEDNTIAIVLSGLTEPAMVIDKLINKSQELAEEINNRKTVSSKLDKLSARNVSKVAAKQSFAEETTIVNAANGNISKEEMLKRFLERKNAK